MKKRLTFTLTDSERLELYAALQAGIAKYIADNEPANRIRATYLLGLLQAAERINLCSLPADTPRHAPVEADHA